MWTVTGAFEGAVAGETNFEKVKLVKPGKEYVVGRKDCALLINDRKVSRKHQVFVVGKHTAQDVENPNVIPTLELHNLSINRWVERDGQKLPVNAGAVMSLQGGDKVDVLHNVVISVQWQEIVCYCPPSKESIMPSMEECAKLGLKVVWKLHPSVTHHVTPELSLDPAVATSLLSLTKFVTPDWLQTILKRGSSSDPSLSLEHEFTLPSLSQFRPALSPNLPPSLQSYRSWEPNEARVDLFKPFRFIFVGERGREVAEEYVELVRRGGAGYSCCAVQGGRKALHSALAKGKEMEQELVLVANVAAMVAAVGEDEWDELVKEAAQYELVFISHSELVEAVAHIDLSHVNCRLTHNVEATNSSTPSSAQPSESRQEPLADIPPPPRRKLVRRAGSSTPGPSMPPPDVPASSSIIPATPAGTMDSQAPAPPRRRLIRRAGVAKPTIVGVDDPSIIEEAPPNMNPGASSSAEPPPPATQSRPNRLKRRAGVTQPQESQLFAAIDASLAVVEPPHKKYKALFEQSDPDRVTQSGASITQPETPFDQPGASSHSAPLPVVTEEEEESINPSGAVSQQVGTLERSQGTKRPRTDVDDDVDMEDVERPAKRPTPDTGISESHTASTGSQAAPRSASVKPFSSTQINIDKTSKAGAAPGKPDRDEAFLKAVASTKKGKKHEDDFDREFNDLRISKPDLEQEKVREDWGILDDFGDDSNLRGNFMVVVEMDVFRKENSARNAMRVAGGRADWEGRPDFKKFKKKATGERRKPVELVVEDDESGMSQDTWRGALSQPRTQSQPVRTERHQMESPRKKTGLVVDSDDDLPAAKPASKKPASSQGQRKPEPRARATQKSRASQKKANPLFLDSEEEGEDVAEEDSAAPPGGEEDENDSEGTLTTTGRRTQPARSNVKKRSAPALIIDDDSDDGATFQGFGRKKTRR